MFTAEQYRAKASEYAKLMETANGPNEVREYQSLERSFTELVDNAQCLVFGYSFIFGFGYSLLSHAGRFTISELGDLMADRGDIFIRIVIVVGIMECVCVGLWLFHSPLNT
jgi:hypothetical protein